MTAAVAPTAASPHLTVPMAARELGLSLDKFRQQLRDEPSIAGLFDVRIGPTRAISRPRLGELRAALGLPPE